MSTSLASGEVGTSLASGRPSTGTVSFGWRGMAGNAGGFANARSIFDFLPLFVGQFNMKVAAFAPYVKVAAVELWMICSGHSILRF